MTNDLLAGLNEQGWLTTSQVADLFGVPRKYVSELTKSRKGRPPLIAAHKIGHLLLVRREAAQKYQAEHPQLGQRIARRLLEAQRAAS